MQINSVVKVKGFLRSHHNKTAAYNTNQAHRAPFSVFVLPPFLHRTTLGHLFFELSQDNTFHEKAGPSSNTNHAEDASLARTVLATLYRHSS